ncbi:serine/threonine-protein kinase [Nonomuraea sp. CA-218870]|uniref:serine/threonine-protein kinase n=1 Tax=Nonomuraea sp. CA-218870 TaxID=3239998 RepID=UPI003D93FB26
MRGDAYLLARRYHLLERLGEGGAGTVWRARDTVLNREVAVKQVRVPPQLTPGQRARFADRAIHEARTAGRLRDPAIVMIHDVVLEGDQPWIIMDLVTGRSLEQAIREYGPLPPESVARIGLSVLSALRVAHSHGMVHQDVKPGNILLDADGSAMLTDFGIAVTMGVRGDHYGSAGSPGYMAPERLNDEPSGPASDLWSLGASLYTAVEGRPPFERPNPAALAAAVLLHDPTPPARAGRELGGLLTAMLAKDPAARPTAGQVHQALERVASGHVRAASGRRAWWPALLVAAAVLLGAGGWYGWTALNRGEPGRYATAPDPCRLLTDAQAEEVLGGATRPERSREGECQWLLRLGSQMRSKLTVRVWTERPDGSRGGPEVAARRFDLERTGRQAAAGSVFREQVGEVRDVPGVGEAAFVQTRFEYYITSRSSGRADTRVLLRDSNLIAEVVWHRADVTAALAADEKNAVTATAMVSGALRG